MGATIAGYLFFEMGCASNFANLFNKVYMHISKDVHLLSGKGWPLVSRLGEVVTVKVIGLWDWSRSTVVIFCWLYNQINMCVRPQFFRTCNWIFIHTLRRNIWSITFILSLNESVIRSDLISSLSLVEIDDFLNYPLKDHFLNCVVALVEVT